MDTAYHPDFGGHVGFKFEAMPESADAQVHMTIRTICGHVLRDSSAPVIREQAAEALRAGGGDPIKGVWESVTPYIRFQQDFDTAQKLVSSDPRKASVVETIIPPAVQAWLIRLRGYGVEDCDGFTMYGAALLCAMGIPVYFCTVSAEGDRPREFTHVYLVAYPNGHRVPLDLSHGPYPGWECPNLGRKREWPVSFETLKPSIVPPLLLAGVAAGFLLWRRAA